MKPLNSMVTIGDPTGTYGTQDHKGPYGKGPYGTIIDHAGPYWIIQERMGDQIRPYETVRTKQDQMGPYGTIWDHTGPNGTIQDHTGTYRTIQDLTLLYRAIMDPRRPNVTLLQQLGPYLTTQDHIEPNESIWGTICDPKAT